MNGGYNQILSDENTRIHPRVTDVRNKPRTWRENRWNILSENLTKRHRCRILYLKDLFMYQSVMTQNYYRWVWLTNYYLWYQSLNIKFIIVHVMFGTYPRIIYSFSLILYHNVHFLYPFVHIQFSSKIVVKLLINIYYLHSIYICITKHLC